MARLAVAALALLAFSSGHSAATPITTHDALGSLALSSNESVSGYVPLQSHTSKRMEMEIDSDERCEQFVRSRSHSPHQPRDLHARAPNPADDNLLRKYEQQGRLVYNPWLFAATGEAADRLIAHHKGVTSGTPSYQWKLSSYAKKDLYPWTTSDFTPTLAAGGLGALGQAVSKLFTPGYKDKSLNVPATLARIGLYPNGPNVALRMVQDRTWHTSADSSSKREATCGMYEAVYNVLDGVMILTSLIEPSEAMRIMPVNNVGPGELPDGSSWHEAVWRTWYLMHSRRKESLPFNWQASLPPNSHILKNGPMSAFEPNLGFNTISRALKGYLNYVLLEPTTFQATDSASIVERCLLSRGKHTTPAWDEREEYLVGHWCFYALLAAEPSQGLAWMLATNKQVGHKILKAVIIFSADQAEPTLLWAVADYNPQWGLIKDDFERQWLKKHDQHGNYGYPNVITSALLSGGSAHSSSSHQDQSGSQAPAPAPQSEQPGLPALTHTSSDIALPGPAAPSFQHVPQSSTDGLKTFVELGRNQYTNFILADVNRAQYLMEQKLGKSPTPRGWQKNFHDYLHWQKLWSSTDASQSVTAGEIQSLVGGMTVGKAHPDAAWESRRSISTGLYPHGPNVRIAFKQDSKYSPPGSVQEMQPTNALYDIIFNLVDGVIIIRNSAGPIFSAAQRGAHLSEDHLPPNPHLSDILWIGWSTLRGRNPKTRAVDVGDDAVAFKKWLPPNVLSSVQLMNNMRTFLNYIVIEDISYPLDTLAVVRRCLSSRGQNSVPSFENRQVFPIGHWCYYALLATKNSVGVAWFLAQHKAEDALGFLVATEVAIYAASSAWPTLCWTIAPWEEGQVNTKTRVENLWHGQQLEGNQFPAVAATS